MKRFFCAVMALIILCCPLYAFAAEAAPDWDSYIQEFMESAGVDPETVSFGYYNTVTGAEYYHRGNAEMVAASVSKLPLNMYFAEKLSKGEITAETHFGGVQFPTLQEYSLRYSSNQCTDILIAEIGDFAAYRKAVSPYLGLDPEGLSQHYLTTNTMTAAEAMYALKLLYGQPERFPGVAEALTEATPGEHFEELVSEYEIIQKYGWYTDETGNYVNCLGFVYTEEPILLAVFSDTCAIGNKILGLYCQAMCRFTEADIAYRAELAAAVEEAPEATPAPTADP